MTPFTAHASPTATSVRALSFFPPSLPPSVHPYPPSLPPSLLYPSIHSHPPSLPPSPPPPSLLPSLPSRGCAHRGRVLFRGPWERLGRRGGPPLHKVRREGREGRREGRRKGGQEDTRCGRGGGREGGRRGEWKKGQEGLTTKTLRKEGCY